MKLDKLGKKLKKELTRNGKKTAALGLCCLVAAYFWAPLIGKWMGKGGPPAAAPAVAAAPVVQGAGVTPVGSTTAPKTPALAWSDIVELMQRDPRAATASLADGTRDPFTRVKPPTPEALAVTETSTQPEVAAPPEVTPTSMGLVLTSTLVSRRGGVATISGNTYGIGEAIELPASGGETTRNTTPAKRLPEASEPVGAETRNTPGARPGPPAPPQAETFTLIEIHPQHVVLERLGVRYELAMQESAVAKGNRLIIRSTSAKN